MSETSELIARVNQLEAENARLRNLTHTPIGTLWRDTALARLQSMNELLAEIQELKAAPK